MKKSKIKKSSKERLLLKLQKLTFEKKNHEYKLDGVIIPSVTQAIKESGLIDLSFINKDLLEYKSDIGTKIHTTTELYDNNNIDLETLHPLLKGYLGAWIKFRNECQFTPILIEAMMFHPTYRYSGRIDRIGEIGYALSVVDIKSGTPHHSYAIQSAGYTEMYNYGKPKKEQIKRRFTLYLREDGMYLLKEHKNPNDIKVFLASLTITNYLRSI